MDEKHYNMNLNTVGLNKPDCQVYRRSIRNKVLDAIFGRKNRLLIIAPSSCVTGISFTAVDEEKGEADERCNQGTN